MASLMFFGSVRLTKGVIDRIINNEDAPDTGAAPKQQQQVIPQTTAISSIKLPILKKKEYDIWAMEMEHYLEYIDNEVWKVIQNGNSKNRISTRKDGIVRLLSPVTAAELQAVEKERKAKNILLMAIPKEHMRRFHGMDDAKENWEAIRTRFGGNANSKKMQKAIFKQQFEAFKISSSEGLEKGYDRFQQLLSQLEAHGAEVSTEGANHKFLISLPAAWIYTALLKKEHLSHLSSIDVLIDRGRATDLDLLNRRDSIRLLGDLDRIEATDLAQKARIKSALEGDENSSFFHATLKKNRHQLAIKNILNEGEWIENPDNIKTVFVDHFRNREFLERSFSRDEIKRAVWDCEGDRAPRPDGFTFKFFATFWDILESDVIRFVQEFFLTGSFPKGCNSSFIALIPKVFNATLVTDFRPISLIGCQYKILGKILANHLSMVIGSCISPEQSAFIKGRNILDGPLILNEVIEWYRKRKKQLMIFKVDFEKAFDSLRWDFLYLVMAKLGFGIRWRNWIKGCLRHARSSVLVNGSPTVEFEISKGLRQDDPLSPFLFILAMEGLHALICKALNCGINTGAYIEKDNLRISHLIYADDVIFTGINKNME
ncbi:putative RNA-directed DNA polymerase, eukaryota, reverse transcriptase zinc-binding domain protein [Tanacetum coccineum]